MQGLYTGQLTNVKAALQDLQDRSETALDNAIAAARKQGANVSRADWVFADWKPSENYVTSAA
jgi:multiple sugar transport system substrate-binding protein